MSSFQNHCDQQPHLQIPKDATEPQILISLGEAALERAHRVSHGIEEIVHRLLNSDSTPFSSSSSHQSDQILSNDRAGDGQGEAKDAVDKAERRW